MSPVKSSFLSEDRIYDLEGAFFKVAARRKRQKPIFFGKFETELKVLEPSEAGEESLNFYKHNSKIVRMMKQMGYNFKKKLGLNFRKGVRTQPRRLVPLPQEASPSTSTT